MKYEYLTFDKITKLADWWIDENVTRVVEIAALEPLIWKDGNKNIVDVVKLLKDKDFTVTMTSNAAHLYKYAKLLKYAGLDLLRISWHSMDDNIYKLVTGGGKLEKLLAGLDAAIAEDLNISINRVLMRGYTSDLIEHIAYIDRHGLRLKLLDLYWTPDSAKDYDNYYISPQEVLNEFVQLGLITLATDSIEKHGRKRVRYYTANGGIVEYKLQSSVNRHLICESCIKKDNCLEGFGDYLRVFPEGVVSLCYLRHDLGVSIFKDNDSISVPSDFMDVFLSEFINTIPLRLVLEGRCNFNCGFPKSVDSWCLKQGRGYIFPQRKLVIKNVD
jgi:molybdenum cofactor biosynthesis enzyme MoaA